MNGKNVKFKQNIPKFIEKQGWLQYKLTTVNDIYPNKVTFKKVILNFLFFLKFILEFKKTIF
jgi:hypothetical protein